MLNYSVAELRVIRNRVFNRPITIQSIIVIIIVAFISPRSIFIKRIGEIKTVIIIYIVNRICNILFHFALSWYNFITDLTCNLPRSCNLIWVNFVVIIIGACRRMKLPQT